MYLFGLEVANTDVLTQEETLRIREASKARAHTQEGKPVTAAHLKRKLVEFSDYSCSFDPVAAAFMFRDDLWTFQEMLVKVDTELEEGKIFEVPRPQAGQKIEGA